MAEPITARAAADRMGLGARSRVYRPPRARRAVVRALEMVALLLIALFVIVPIWPTLVLALDASVPGFPDELRLWPGDLSLQVFVDVWNAPTRELSYLGLLRNSLIVAGGAALISLVFGITMSYAFARLRFPGRRVGQGIILVGALLPFVALMTPLFLLLSQVGIRDSLLGLMVVYAAFSLPLAVWLTRASFSAVPEDLEAAAFVDGAGRLTTFLRITLPLALPSILVAAVIAFLIGYSEFAIGWLFITKGEDVTLAMALWGPEIRQGGAFARLAALCVLMTIPVILVFVVLQRRMLRDVRTGLLEG